MLYKDVGEPIKLYNINFTHILDARKNDMHI